VVKAGAVRRPQDQPRWLLKRLAADLPDSRGAVVMLQYTDNLTWIEEKLQPLVARAVPGAEILIQPLSLTTGVHTGPGSWAAAFLPALPGREQA
jgi:hypothetical protein